MRQIAYSCVRLFAAAAFLVSAAVCLSADEWVIPDSASPDGKWECRRTEIDEAMAEKGVDTDRAIVRAGTTERVVELPLTVGGQGNDEPCVLWAPDSKRFAYNLRAGGRYNTTQVYQLRNGKWIELRSLESEETTAPLDRVQTAQLRKLGVPKDSHRRRIWDTWEVRRWIDARTAMLYVHSVETVLVKKKEEEEIVELAAHFLFTIRFDERGNWKIIKSHRMSDKEVEEQNAPAEPAE